MTQCFGSEFTFLSGASVCMTGRDKSILNSTIPYINFMKIPNRKETLGYLKGQALGQFIGFYVGMSSTGLVSQFFETRGISNLWGVLARKPILDAQTFNILERIVAVVIGFIVFEIVSRNLKPLIANWKPVVAEGIARRRKDQGWDARAKALRVRAMSIYSSVTAVVREAIKKHFQK